MNILESRVVGVLGSIVVLAVAACSAAPPSDPELEGEESEGASQKAPKQQKPERGGDEEDEEGTGTGGGTGTGNPPSGGNQPAPKGDGGGAPPPGGGAQCGAEQNADACFDCCVAVDPAGIQVGDDAFVQCACQNPGTCQAACGDNFCTNPDQATPECEQCLQGAQQCEQVADTACEGNAGCKAVMGCFEQSQCNAKAQ